MKQIIAIVKPFLVEKVLDALHLAPVEALVVREVKGFSRQKSYLDQYAETEYSLAFLPKVEIRLWVDDARAEEMLRKIATVARTGRIGDGKILLLPVVRFESVIDIATGEQSQDSETVVSSAKPKTLKTKT
jgi:nitrogen regulatory protein PII